MFSDIDFENYLELCNITLIYFKKISISCLDYVECTTVKDGTFSTYSQISNKNFEPDSNKSQT